MIRFGTLAAAAVVLVAGLAPAASAQLIDDITYQGQLRSGGSPVTGLHQFRFRIFPDPFAGVSLGDQIRLKDFNAADQGLFTYNDLAFPASAFNGEDRWLEVSVRSSLSDPYTILGPRQPITAAPLARYADASGTTLADAYANGAEIDTSAGPVRLLGPFGLAVRSQIELGVPEAADGRFLLRSADTDAAIFVIEDDTNGAELRSQSDSGQYQASLEADIDAGGGGFFAVARTDGLFSGIILDGNHVGTLAPRVSFSGPARSAVFDMSVAGDSAVQFPGEVLDAAEIIDEPGVAGIVRLSVAIGDTLAPIASRTITVPGPGYVLAIANAELSANYNGSIAQVIYGISSAPNSISSSQDFELSLPAGLPTGIYDTAASAHNLFVVPSAGAYTYHFVAEKVSTFGTFSMLEVNLTLVYLPTAYGNVGSVFDLAQASNLPDHLAPALAPLTPADLRFEQEAEHARVLAEISRKERELQALFEEHRRILEQTAADQGHGAD